MRPLAIAVVSCFIADAHANPTGATVINGSVSILSNANLLQINNSPGSIINWQSFSIGAGEITRFVQQSSASSVLNRVTTQNPSSILGTLQSNGRVFVINPNGITFGAGSQIDVAGLVASSLNLSNADFLAGRLNFTATPGAGSVVNQGSITTGAGGSVYLVGSAVTNNGVITTPKGEVVLAAGNSVELVNPGTPNLRVEIVAPDNQAVNLGAISADAGRVGIYAGLISHGGTIRADSAEVGAEGQIILKATKQTTLAAGSVLSATGSSGANGGFIETSAEKVAIHPAASITTAATQGGKTGTWLVDPNDYTIAASGGDITGAQLAANLGTNNVTIVSSSGGSSGGGDINVNDAVSWTANTLTLTAARDININAAMTASGSSALTLNPGTANGLDGAVAGGTIKTGFAADGSFAGKVEFGSRSGTGFLTINGAGFTVISSLGAAGSTNGADLQGMNGSLSRNYALGTDIDASATATWNAGAGFAPIGPEHATAYSGTFDGLGHTVSGLTINRPAASAAALFGFAVGAPSIRNIGISGGSISGDVNVAGLIGWNDAATVTNAFNSASVTTPDQAAGGLIGGNRGNISNSYNSGNVHSTGGGAGGLVAYHYGDTGATISNSFNTGNVTSTSDPTFGVVGGLVGGTTPGGAIVNSYSTGSVSGGTYVGGLVGQNWATITNSYSSGAVTGTGAIVGGMLGSNNAALVSVYWDLQVSGKSGCVGSGSAAGCTGLTTAQMTQQANFAGWDFTNTWRISEGVSPPTLRMLPAPAPLSVFWDNDGGDFLWLTPANWSTNRLPGATDNIFLTLGGGSHIDLTSGSVTIASLTSSIGNSLYIKGGSLSVSGSASLAGGANVQSGSLNLDGASSIAGLSLSGGALAGSGAVALTGGSTWTGGTMSGGGLTLNSGATLTVASTGTLTSSRVLDNQGTLNASNGTIQLGSFASNTNSGTINIGPGVAISPGGSLINASTGVIAGSGTLDLGGPAQTLTNNGRLTPGTAAATGTLTINGSLNMGPGGTVDVRIGGASAGQYDVLAVAGSAALDGTLNATLVNGFAPTTSDSFPVVTFASRSGAFASQNLPAGIGGVYNAADLTLFKPLTPVFWDNDSGDFLWDNPTNWSANVRPVSSDAVTLNVGAGSHANVTTGAHVIGALTTTSNNALVVDGGSLTVLGPANLGGTVSVSSGTLNFGGTATLAGSYSQTGGLLTGTSDVHLNGNSTITFGNVTGTGRLINESGGTLVFNPTGDAFRAMINGTAASTTDTSAVTVSRDVTNRGVMRMDIEPAQPGITRMLGTLFVTGHVTNETGATFTLPVGGPFFFSQGFHGNVTNAGVFNMGHLHGGTVDNSGTVNLGGLATGVTFNNLAGATLTGSGTFEDSTVNAKTGSTLNLAGLTLALSQPYLVHPTGPVTVNIEPSVSVDLGSLTMYDGSALNAAGNISATSISLQRVDGVLAGGAFMNSGTTTVGALTLSGGSIAGAGDFHLTGTSTITDGTATGTGKIINEATGTLVFHPSAGSLVHVNRTVRNLGTARMDPDGIHLGGLFLDGGLINELGATFSTPGGALSQGSGPHGVITNAGTFNLGTLSFGTVNNTGTVTFGGYVLKSTINNLAGGTLNGSPTIEASTINLQAQSTANLTALTLNPGDYFFNISPSTVNVAASSTTNLGALTMLGGTGALPVDPGNVITASGAVGATSITINTGAAFTNSGNTTVGALTLNGGSIAGAGDYHLTASSTITSGAITGTGKIINEATGTLVFNPPVNAALSVGRSVQNLGTARMDLDITGKVGPLFLNGGITNEAGATLTTAADPSGGLGQGAGLHGVITNRGTFNLGNLNFGTVNNSGTLTLVGPIGLAKNSTINNLAGGTLNGSGATDASTINLASTSINNLGNLLALSGSTISGAGTLQMSSLGVTNSSVALQAGGAITSSGNITFSGTSSVTGGSFGGTGTFITTAGGTVTFGSAAPVSIGLPVINNGTITVPAGTTLAIQSGGSLKNMASGVILGGGTIDLSASGLALQNDGVLAAGGGAQLNIKGDLTFGSSGSLLVDRFSNVAYDKVVVSGQAALAGTLTMHDFSGGLAPDGSAYSVLTYGSHTSTFPLQDLPPSFGTAYLTDRLNITTPNPTPPSNGGGAVSNASNQASNSASQVAGNVTAGGHSGFFGNNSSKGFSSSCGPKVLKGGDCSIP